MMRTCENALVALFYLYLLTGNLGHGWQAGPVIVQEGLLVVLFLTRRPSLATSTSVWDWFVGVCGTLLPLTIRADGVGWPIGTLLQFVGLTISTLALLSLGRSVGIVAANRGLKTSGAYTIVRHPMYAGHLLTLLGYLILFPTMRNLVLVSTTGVLLVLRVKAEENLLDKFTDYTWYRWMVPKRLIPGVW